MISGLKSPCYVDSSVSFCLTLSPSLLKLRSFFLVAGVLLLVLGMRIFIGIRFVGEVPHTDDYPTLLWLQKWFQGVHDWGFVWQRHNGHPMVLYYFTNLGQYLLNGYWDARLDFLVYALVHTAYATVVIATFWNVLTTADRGWILALVFVLFGLPFAGQCIALGLLWPDTAMMIFSLAALYLCAYHGQSWIAAVLVCVLVALASINMAAGCLGGLAVVALTLFRATLARRLGDLDKIVSIVCGVIFLVQYLSLPGGGHAGFGEGLNAFLKALAWPMVFVPGVGLLTVAPLAGLVAAQIFLPAFRQRNVAYITGAGGLIFLVAFATAAFRGENNNLGMPSERYTDIFLIVPLVCGAALCLLYRGSVGLYRIGWGIFAMIWLCLQIFGLSIHLFYHVIPFMTRESGEGNVVYVQNRFRDLVRGAPDSSIANPSADETFGRDDVLLDAIRNKKPLPAMTLAMVTGFSLRAGSQGTYVSGGYHPSYQPRPRQFYWGSLDINHPVATNQWFLSGLFKPQANYLTIDALVDNKARLSNYHLNGVRLTLLDETTGQRTELLPRLAHTFPFVFRDWELIYVRVTPGDEYRIESHATDGMQWIAFGEPYESGRLTPLIVGAGQSGKLLCLCGLALMVFALGLEWRESLQQKWREWRGSNP